MTGPVDPLADTPKLALDERLAQMIERANGVMAAQSRLRELLRATQAVTQDLDLTTLLHRIVEVACDLLGAQYGALGVIGADRHLEQFIHVGMPPDAVTRIGHLPQGHGLLGALIADPRPIRLANLARDPRAAGFPPSHPPMTSFLGVPIRVRDEVYGNLYLTNSKHGEFTDEDQDLVVWLAAAAGTAIDNARLYADARQRQAWLEASGEVTRQLLSAEGVNALRTVADFVQQMGDADVVTVVLPTGEAGRLMVEVAAGPDTSSLVGLTYSTAQTLAGEAIETGAPVALEDVSLQKEYVVHLSRAVPIGPAVAIPLVGLHRPKGALVIGRSPGRRPFGASEIEMATSFANHAAIALELDDARADQQRLALLKDRDRIARDLHDHVIQRLFAVGLSAQGLASRYPDQDVVARLGEMVDDIDATIRQIRTTIFELRGPMAPAVSSVRTAVLGVVTEMGPALGFSPKLTFLGPVDTATPPDAEDDIVAVTREALANVARHAAATSATVTVEVGEQELCLTIADNGRGIGSERRRSGLANLRSRAERRGGSLAIRTKEGTRLLWAIPLK